MVYCGAFDEASEGSRSRAGRARGNSIAFIDHHFDLPDIARKERREPKQRTRADRKNKPTSSLLRVSRGALPYSGGPSLALA
jgi:hypothetical protein